MDPPVIPTSGERLPAFAPAPVTTDDRDRDRDRDDDALADFASRHPRLFVLSGAGCSTAAGLGDYRDRAGRWKRKQPITGQVFVGDERARRRYWARSAVGWPAFGRASPALAHEALAALQEIGTAAHLVTQNVDTLHTKAGHRDVIDLHGRLAEVRCLGCGEVTPRDAFQSRLLDANPWVADLSAAYAPDGDADLDEPEVQRLDVPACERCGGMLKPDVVFFGENVPRERVQDAIDRLAASDALLVAGSSLMVFSGYRFCRMAAAAGQPIAIVNEGVTRADELATLRVGGDVGSRLARLAAARAADIASVAAQAKG